MTNSRIDFLLSTLNAMDVGTLDNIALKLHQVRQALAEMGESDLARRANETAEALGRGDLAEFRRGRAFLQSRIGHLRP